MEFDLVRNGVKWNKEQEEMVTSLTDHACVMYQSQRCSGTTFAICGMIAHLMLQHEKVNIVLFVTSSVNRQKAAKWIVDFCASERVVVSGTSLSTEHATVHLVLYSENPKFTEPVDVWIVDAADFQPLQVFFKYIVPSLQLHNTRVLLTHTEPMPSFEDIDLFHCVKLSKQEM